MVIWQVNDKNETNERLYDKWTISETNEWVYDK